MKEGKEEEDISNLSKPKYFSKLLKKIKKFTISNRIKKSEIFGDDLQKKQSEIQKLIKFLY